MLHLGFTPLQFCTVLVLASSLMAAEYGAPRVLAQVSIPGLKESSGIAASRKHEGIYWTHNDSGSGARVFAFGRDGKSAGRFQVTGAKNRDWEDIAIGPGPEAGRAYLYIGDIGDNERKRRSITVYRVPEPVPGKDGRTVAAQSMTLRYPDGPHDAEALMVHPATGAVYIVTKSQLSDRRTAVYSVPAFRGGKTQTLRQVARIRLPGLLALTLLAHGITAGDISPDGRHVVLAGYLGAWEAELPPNAKSFDVIWEGDWNEMSVGRLDQGEGVCYRADGGAILATSEGSPFPLTQSEVRRDRAPKAAPSATK